MEVFFVYDGGIIKNGDEVFEDDGLVGYDGGGEVV